MLATDMDEATLPAPPEQRSVSERLCISALFFYIGFVFTSWVPYIPKIKTRFAMSDSHLGATLLLIGLGALLAMAGAPMLMRHLRNRRTLMVALTGLVITFCLVLTVRSLTLFYLVLFAFGLINGLYNVAINAQGSDFERASGRPVMSGFHAFFSIGGFCGAAFTFLIFRWSLGEPFHTALVTAPAFIFLVACLRYLPEDLMPFKSTAAVAAPFRISGGLIAIAAAALIGLAVEGSVTDWLTVYLQRAYSNSLDIAAMGFVVFSGAMTVSRMVGDNLKARFSSARLFQAGLAVAAIGLLGMLSAPQMAVAYLCIFVMGLGLGNLVPIVFSQAGAIPGIDPTKAITVVSVAGYIGYLGSPPLIGMVSDCAGLRWALMGLVPLMALVYVIGARHIR